MDVSSIARSQRFFGIATLLCAFGVVIPLMIGMTITAIRIIGTFRMLSHTGTADPAQLAHEISMALLATFWGIVIAMIFLIPFVVFLILYRKRKKALLDKVLLELVRNGSIAEQPQRQ